MSGRKPGSTTVSDEEKKKILEDYKGGMAPRDVANKYKRSASTVFKLARLAGVHRKGDDPRRKSRSIVKRVEIASQALAVSIVRKSPLERALQSLSHQLRGQYARLEIDLEAMTYRAVPVAEEGSIS